MRSWKALRKECPVYICAWLMVVLGVLVPRWQACWVAMGFMLVLLITNAIKAYRKSYDNDRCAVAREGSAIERIVCFMVSGIIFIAFIMFLGSAASVEPGTRFKALSLLAGVTTGVVVVSILALPGWFEWCGASLHERIPHVDPWDV